MARSYSVPGLDDDTAARVRAVLQARLTALLDLALVLKHVHWNVVGPNFMGVHELLDPQVEAVRTMADDVAERIAALGGEPLGTAGAIVELRRSPDYPLNRAVTVDHLAALDAVYDGVVAEHRSAITDAAALDPVSEDLLIEQTEKLEMFQWLVRAHMEDGSGGSGPLVPGDADAR